MQNPGLLYVIATLLPLAAFLLLFLGGKRWPGKTGAYVAVAGIGGAFVCSLIGFILFLANMEHHDSHGTGPSVHAAKDDHGKPGEPKPAPAAHGHGAAQAEKSAATPPWSGSFVWSGLSGFAADAGATGLRLGYYIDGLGAIMFLMVTFIATLIHIFAIGYMGEELQPTVDDHQAHVTRKGRFPRFFTYFALFSFSMLNLVLADNLFQVFVSWELVGICSYLLIGYYYERRTASDAANKAFITNRVGDAGFIIGILILWTYTGSLSFHSETEPARNRKGEIMVEQGTGKVVQRLSNVSFFEALRAPGEDTHGDTIPVNGRFARVKPATADGEQKWQLDEAGSHVLIWDQATRRHFHAPENGQVDAYHASDDGHGHGFKAMPYWMLVLAGVGIFLGCVGKSAQFPLQVWLPDAMEGPTPVSALVHSATMVAAGVYLVGRVYPLFTPEVLLVIAYTGCVTLFVAATIAVVQTDIKKVLAYSTVSQLGFMMMALGVGGWVAGLFHLLTHAFFKALLFLCSGSVIYGCHHEQDMTKMGGLFPKMKITALTMLVGVLAIAGTPLFTGWYSKDAMLVGSLSFVSLNPQHFLLFFIPLLTAGITAFYMFRLWFMTFTGTPRDAHVYEHAHESPRVMTFPLMILALCSLVVAWGTNPFNVQASALEGFLHHHGPRPASLTQDTGLHLSAVVNQAETTAAGGNFFARDSWLSALHERLRIGPHDVAGVLALTAAILGAVLALAIYYYRALDPEETKERFPALYNLFAIKWYFDELYSAALVRPALVVGQWARWFDTKVIDGLIDNTARLTVKVARWDGRFDLGVVDGLVNLTANVIHAIGAWLRGWQTGLIRNYILFLALALVGLFAVLSYVTAGQ